MEQLSEFFGQYGIVCTLIALGGVVLLGLLKYFKCFDKYEKNIRKFWYLGITIAVSGLGTLIFQIATDVFTFDGFFALACSLFTLMQGFYFVFDTTPINKWATKLLTAIVEFLNSNSAIEELDTTEQAADPSEETEADPEEDEDDPEV